MSTLTDTLENIHTAMAERLLARLNEGEITAAEMRVALDMLRHNGINSDAMKNPTLRGIAEKLPNVDELAKWRS